MNLIHAIMLAGLVMHNPLILDREFFDWWNKHDEHLQSEGDYVYHYVTRVEIPFTALSEYQGTVQPPEGIGQAPDRLFLVYSDDQGTVLLGTPGKPSDNGAVLDEGYAKKQRQCRGEHSWLVQLPENTWTPVDLNPYCGVIYGEEHVALDFYWTDTSNRPHIDIVTSSLACTPHQLFSWKEKPGQYALKSVKCTGPRDFKAYSPETPYMPLK